MQAGVLDTIWLYYIMPRKMIIFGEHYVRMVQNVPGGDIIRPFSNLHMVRFT